MELTLLELTGLYAVLVGGALANYTLCYRGRRQGAPVLESCRSKTGLRSLQPLAFALVVTAVLGALRDAAQAVAFVFLLFVALVVTASNIRAVLRERQSELRAGNESSNGT